jgi:hypothetical protein
MLQAGRSPVRVPDEVDFFNLRNPSNHTMALVSTQPLTEMSTRDLPGGKKRPARKTDNLHGLYGDNFTLPLPLLTLHCLNHVGFEENSSGVSFVDYRNIQAT